MSSNKRKFRKLFILFIIVFITSITLIFETYAWFVGISTVSINNFDVSVSSGEGLELSLNGSSWSSDSISIDPATIESIYSGNTNKWASDGLTPVSTNGLLDSTSSKLNLYEKASLASTTGGYKIVAGKIDNSVSEQKGYIAFDLFIRNKTGNTSVITSTYQPDAEESIYLTANSNVFAPTAGTNNEGLANSVRIGFFEIGRYALTASASSIRNLSCSTAPNLCATSEQLESRRSYTWNIWEPNAAKHATNLVNYFNQICKIRTGTDTYSDASCFPLEVGSSRKTYALNSITSASDNVDIYDGLDLNEYSDSSKVSKMTTYKTSYATSSGSNKAPLLRIAGNSITKVRVYIWLEGQDIDNYDIATQDSQININFGFTKDRFGINENNVNNPSSGRTSSFEDDSWSEIQANIRSGNTNQYKIGDTREVVIDGKGYTLRLVNKSSNDSKCSGSTNSQTACGFVVEFADIVELKKMHSTIQADWPSTDLYTYLQGDFYNKLPDDLRGVIITTRDVTWGYSSGALLTTNDKLYLLSVTELFGDSNGFFVNSDNAKNYTRRLDYYALKTYECNNGGICSMPLSIKKYNDAMTNYWLRNYLQSGAAYVISSSGNMSNGRIDISSYGVAPAFRIA